MLINNRPIVGPARSSGSLPINQKPDTQHIESNFGTVLKEKLQAQTGVKFSKHAELRLQARNINLNSNQMERIRGGVNKAEDKGIKDSLVLVDNIALVVNVKSKTVVTATKTNELNENVFTNIDGAVIV